MELRRQNFGSQCIVEVSTVSKKFKINLEGQNYVHFKVILSKNVKIFGIMASLKQIGKT